MPYEDFLEFQYLLKNPKREKKKFERKEEKVYHTG